MKLNIVPARTGIQWVRLGIRTFFKRPLALASLFFIYAAGASFLSLVPYIGWVLALAIVPAATLGLMAATEDAATGHFPMPTVLLSAFRVGRQRGRAMLVLGALYTAGSLVATVLGSLVGGSGASGGDSTGQSVDPRTVAVLVLHLPLVVLFWHAPALVHWHGVPPVKSLFFSAVACLRNARALLVYGFAWVVVFLVAGFAISAIGMMVGGLAVARSIMMPTVLVLVAMFSTSLYFTFRDSFRADEPQELPDAPL